MTAEPHFAPYLGDVNRLLRPLFLAILLGCAGDPALGPTGIAEVERVMEDFRLAWLDQDSARVMRHISPEVTMIIPGPAGTVSGKEQLRRYWFPTDGKAYPIRTFTVADQSVYGGGRFAIVEGRTTLAWDTTVHDSVISSAASKNEFLTVLRKEDGDWKIYRQIFVLR